MPHGSGHHSGGGGHSGGHHHGQYHHYGSSNINDSYYSTGWRNRRETGSGRRCRPLSWVLTVIFMLVMVTIICSVSLRYTESAAEDSLYAPTDTRIIPFSGLFCQALRLKVTAPYRGYTATLSMLQFAPTLGARESFSIRRKDIHLGPGDYQYYYFYMYPGSSFTVSGCIVITDNRDYRYPTFLLVRGKKNFKKWKEDVDNLVFSKKDSFKFNAQCSKGEKTSHTYRISHEDYYYLVYDGDYFVGSSKLDALMSFERTLYKTPSNDTVLDSCSNSTEDFGASCSVNVPFSILGLGQGEHGRSTALLTITPRSGVQVDWSEDAVGVDTNCVPRIWTYVVISAVIVIVAVLLLLLVLACVAAVRCSKKRRRERRITGSRRRERDTSVAAVPGRPRGVEPSPSEGDPLLTPPPTTLPPPTNPHLQQQPSAPPPPYERDFKPPPQYTP